MIRNQIPTAERGIWPSRPRGWRSRSRQTWKGRQIGHSPAGASLLQPLSFPARLSSLRHPERRGLRALTAARAKHQAGAFDAAVELLDAAELCPLDDLRRAQCLLLRGQIMFAAQSAHAGLPLMIDAAQQLERLEPTLANETYRDAFYAALTAGRLPGNVLTDIAGAVRAARQGRIRRARICS